MALLARLKRDTYRDSVELMRLAAELGSRPGLRQLSAVMATPANLELLRSAGLLVDELAEARPNDLCLAAEADDAATACSARRPRPACGALQKETVSPEEAQVLPPLRMTRAVG